MGKGPWAGQRQWSSLAWALHHPPGSPGSWWEGRSRQWCPVQGVQLEQEAGSRQPRKYCQEPSPFSLDLSPGDPLWLASSKASWPLPAALAAWACRQEGSHPYKGHRWGCRLWVPFCFAPSPIPSCTQCQPGEKNSSLPCSGPGL